MTSVHMTACLGKNNVTSLLIFWPDNRTTCCVVFSLWFMMLWGTMISMLCVSYSFTVIFINYVVNSVSPAAYNVKQNALSQDNVLP